jgi:glycosyltransferase involved in cell wall biosynthesis
MSEHQNSPVRQSGGSHPQVTLVVTTYNRQALVLRALQSIAASDADPAAYQVLVVDNNSSDDTAAVVKAFIAAHPHLPLHYLFEARQGLSHARNKGLAAARGRCIAFMDDDQEIDARYLSLLTAAFDRTGAACLGGRIFYTNADALPDWLAPLVDRIGQIDLGPETRALDERDPCLKGGNIAFLTQELRALGGFDPQLGRIGDALGAGEEDAVQATLRRQGKAIFYCPELVQYNVLLPEKWHKRYWREQAYARGRTDFLRSRSEWERGVRWFGVPRTLYRALILSVARLAAATLGLDGVRRFQRERDVRAVFGQMVEARAQSRLQR